jgi:hypothetical protein
MILANEVIASRVAFHEPDTYLRPQSSDVSMPKARLLPYGHRRSQNDISQSSWCFCYHRCP